MSKTQLQTNNTKLEALITELQGKAAGGGSGGSVEMCTVEFLADAPIASNQMLTYLDADSNIITKTPSSSEWMIGFTLSVPANTPIESSSAFGMLAITGGAIKLSTFCLHITGDSTITIVG